MQGVVGTYVHHDRRRVGVAVLSCQTDFCARTAEFRAAADAVAAHLAASDCGPLWSQGVGSLLVVDVEAWLDEIFVISAEELSLRDYLATVAKKLKEDVRLVEFFIYTMP